MAFILYLLIYCEIQPVDYSQSATQIKWFTAPSLDDWCKDKNNSAWVIYFPGYCTVRDWKLLTRERDGHNVSVCVSVSAVLKNICTHARMHSWTWIMVNITKWCIFHYVSQLYFWTNIHLYHFIWHIFLFSANMNNNMKVELLTIQIQIQ